MTTVSNSPVAERFPVTSNSQFNLSTNKVNTKKRGIFKWLFSSPPQPSVRPAISRPIFVVDSGTPILDDRVWGVLPNPNNSPQEEDKEERPISIVDFVKSLPKEQPTFESPVADENGKNGGVSDNNGNNIMIGEPNYTTISRAITTDNESIHTMPTVVTAENTAVCSAPTEVTRAEGSTETGDNSICERSNHIESNNIISEKVRSKIETPSGHIKHISCPKSDDLPALQVSEKSVYECPKLSESIVSPAISTDGPNSEIIPPEPRRLSPEAIGAPLSGALIENNFLTTPDIEPSTAPTNVLPESSETLRCPPSRSKIRSDRSLSSKLKGVRKRSELSLRSRQLTPSDIALRLFQGKADLINHVEAAAWLGDSSPDRAEIRKAYMRLFDWTNNSVLASLRGLCDKLYMKAESQQLDRIIDAFSDRWCECNPRHGFKSAGVIYTLAYSILLLNTDHHSEEYTSAKKMPRSQYVQQTFETMKSLLKGEGTITDDSNSILSRKRTSIDSVSRQPSSMKRWSTTLTSTKVDNITLVCDDAHYSMKEWEGLMVALLKGIYTSIDLTPLNLARGTNLSPPRLYLHAQSSANSLSNYYGTPPHTPVENGRSNFISRLTLNRRSSWISGGSDAWSDYEYQGVIANNQPIMGNRKSMYINADEPIGFSGVLRNTIIREERAVARAEILGRSDFGSISGDSLIDSDDDEGIKSNDGKSSSIASSVDIRRGRSRQQGDSDGTSSPVTPRDDYLNSPTTMITINNSDDEGEDEEVAFEEKLELTGAPWAKEGLLKFKAFIDGGISKKYKKRESWLQVFVIVQKGYLKVFRFDHPTRNQRPINYTFDPPNAYTNVGGGNWLDRATLTDNIPLCQTMAQTNPINNHSEAGMRSSIIISSSTYMSMLEPDYVDWSLALPNKSVLMFRAGTKQIADEYVYSCNYWAARVSKEPLVEAVSSSEYGWGIPLEILAGSMKQDPSYILNVQSGSFDSLVIDNKKIQIREWRSPLVSQVLSVLDESHQLEMLRKFNASVEHFLEDHNASRALMIRLFQPSFLVSTRAHSNWERKSQYLLKETVKYSTYISTLERGMKERKELELKSKLVPIQEI